MSLSALKRYNSLMADTIRIEKAQRIRDVIRYVDRFKNAVVVIYLDDIDSPLFSSHIRDIALIKKAGLEVLIVPGSRSRIDEVLSAAHISWTIQNDVRVTAHEAMPLIKMAAFDVSNTVMTSLAANRISAVIGNWVRSRAIGVLDGKDYGDAGEIDKLETDAIRTVLADGFVPIFPCIGWSRTGKPYNISSPTLAKEIAVQLQADKLFFVTTGADIDAARFTVPPEIAVTETGEIPALNLEELDSFIEANAYQEHAEHGKILSLLRLAKSACASGVARIHIVNGSFDGVLPCEIFSGFGSGTMVYSENYGGIRTMQTEDIPAVLSLMRPFVASGKLLPRSDADLLESLDDYIVYELDGGIRACAALHVYDARQAEIAAVAVDESCANIGVGPKLIEFLLKKAKREHTESVFILTTQAADWFENLGFVQDDIATLPEKRKEKWTPNRGSKLYRLKLR